MADGGVCGLAEASGCRNYRGCLEGVGRGCGGRDGRPRETKMKLSFLMYGKSENDGWYLESLRKQRPQMRFDFRREWLEAEHAAFADRVQIELLSNGVFLNLRVCAEFGKCRLGIVLAIHAGRGK